MPCADFLFMRDNNDRDALRVEALQQCEDLGLAFAVEVAGRSSARISFGRLINARAMARLLLRRTVHLADG